MIRQCRATSHHPQKPLTTIPHLSTMPSFHLNKLYSPPFRNKVQNNPSRSDDMDKSKGFTAPLLWKDHHHESYIPLLLLSSLLCFSHKSSSLPPLIYVLISIRRFNHSTLPHDTNISIRILHEHNKIYKREQSKVKDMCWLVSIQHRCTHWGRPEVESQCQIGSALNLRTGCWDNTIQGVKRAGTDCTACSYFDVPWTRKMVGKGELEVRAMKELKA